MFPRRRRGLVAILGYGLPLVVLATICGAAAAQGSRQQDRVSQRERFQRIAEEAIQSFQRSHANESDLKALKLAIQAAEAELSDARLRRQVAEIAVKVYEEGAYLQDLATCEGELQLAVEDGKRAESQIAEYEKLLERVKKASDGSVRDIMAVLSVENMVKTAKLSRQKAGYQAEQAEIRIKVLKQYEKGKKLRELRSEVEKASFAELMKTQSLQLAKDKFDQMSKEAEAPDAPARFGPVLGVLAEAARLDQEMQARFENHDRKHEAAPNSSDPEIRRLTDSFVKSLDDAERLLGDLRMAIAAKQLRTLARRAGVEVKVPEGKATP